MMKVLLCGMGAWRRRTFVMNDENMSALILKVAKRSMSANICKHESNFQHFGHVSTGGDNVIIAVCRLQGIHV